MARGGSGVSRKTNTGIAEAIKDLSKTLKRLDTVPEQILAEEAPRIQAEARLLTPVESGKLKSHVNVQVSRSKSTPGIYATASAVKKNYDYAGIQHENTHYNHPNGGQAKFLEIPFVRGVERITERMESEIFDD